MMLKEGDTFFLLNSATKVRHLHIVLSDPEKSADEVFIVMVSSRPDRKDDKNVCYTLREGDHPFLRHNSVVVCSIPPAMLTSLAELEQLRIDGKLSQNKNQAPIQLPLLKRIREGYVRSPFRGDRAEQLLYRQELIDD